ncbi:hypothetical protein Z517_01914 [Fonsecaea pedrosoi CBS 271.37]|uniref:Arrestin-like N-terminal domain-containing protein n=1 Tax=Fonsecaea pedrosoi CBS 271.37 TaxID=1442368 RepID=A0A0D2E8U5_9EURO|nr:uncharacterized protein Z517_01914 [Fonsecaea pedrosoi CBS 271.37]KIW86516.1 hypothetical protein Z517_01914 [Fonsecaea pedrosoi CBS 271.37]
MALSIKLSYDEEKPLTPGSMVLGVVKLTTYEERIIESLNIDFKGRTKVFLNQYYSDMVVSRTDYTSESYLFSRHMSLHSGESIEDKGTYSWPFAFRIPLFAAPRAVAPGTTDSFYPMRPWKGDLARVAHPLPPSMKQSGKFICSIQYVLEATLVYRPPAANHLKRKGATLQASRSISVQSLDMTCRTRPGDDWPYSVHRHTMCCAPGRYPSQSIYRLIPILPRTSAHSASEAKLFFSVWLPKKVEIKEQQALFVPISCTMGHSTVGQELSPLTDEQCPNAVVCSFKLALVRHTQVRAGSHTSSSSQRVFIRRGSVTVPVSHGEPSATQTTTSTPTSSANLCDATDMSLPPDLLTADFSTYNIARFHSLEISFRMKYRKKKHKFTLRDVPLRVVAQSERELERRLSEGIEEDDEYGCYLSGIQWQDYRANTSGTGDPTREFLQAIIAEPGGDGDCVSEIPPPGYTA